MPVTAEERKALEEKGVWEAYQKYYAWLKNQGMKPAAAKIKAMQRHLHNGLVEGMEYEAREYDRAIKGLADISDPVELIRWVASNMEVVEPDLEGCPGRDAHALWKACQEDKGFKIDFWKSMFTKILPSRALVGEETKEGEVDGGMTIGILERIGEISKRARGE